MEKQSHEHFLGGDLGQVVGECFAAHSRWLLVSRAAC